MLCFWSHFSPFVFHWACLLSSPVESHKSRGDQRMYASTIVRMQVAFLQHPFFAPILLLVYSSHSWWVEIEKLLTYPNLLCAHKHIFVPHFSIDTFPIWLFVSNGTYSKKPFHNEKSYEHNPFNICADRTNMLAFQKKYCAYVNLIWEFLRDFNANVHTRFWPFFRCCAQITKISFVLALFLSLNSLRINQVQSIKNTFS